MPKWVIRLDFQYWMKKVWTFFNFAHQVISEWCPWFWWRQYSGAIPNQLYSKTSTAQLLCKSHPHFSWHFCRLYMYMHAPLTASWHIWLPETNLWLWLSECAAHCSHCFNATECYLCTDGFYLDMADDATHECTSKNLWTITKQSKCTVILSFKNWTRPSLQVLK